MKTDNFCIRKNTEWARYYSLILGMYSGPSWMGGTSTPNQKRVPLWYPQVPPILGGTIFFQQKLSTPNFGGYSPKMCLIRTTPKYPPLLGVLLRIAASWVRGRSSREIFNDFTCYIWNFKRILPLQRGFGDYDSTRYVWDFYKYFALTMGVWGAVKFLTISHVTFGIFINICP